VADPPRRKLAAIMFTDIVGFAAVTQQSESRGLALLERHNRLLRPTFSRHRGREVKAIGDGFLVEFESALDAVNCALEIQRALREYNTSAEEDWQVHVRIGVHLGDVVPANGDVLGDAVNLASRIEPLARPDGICVSEQVYAQVRNKLPASFERLPARELKNIQGSVEVYAVGPADEGPAVPPRRTPPAGTHRLAVLPFSNMSPDPKDEFFADGLTEELISELARLPGCQVIARTSVMRYKAAPKGIREVGRELGVDVTLEGSVRKSGDRIRVTTQLIDTATEAHLWADRFDREFGEIFDLQSEIASRVATALKVELAPGGRGAAGRSAPRNLAAYESYLKGRQAWWQAGEADYRAALRYFERAIELDPTYALAYCGLADSHALLGNRGHVPMPEALRLAEAAARKALALDPDLADAHVSLAPILYNRYDWAGAERELRRALELDPNHVLGHYWLAVAVAAQGKLTEALELSRKVAGLDPLSRATVLAPAFYLYYLHRFDEALAYVQEIEKRIGYRPDHLYGLCQMALGQFGPALESIRKATGGTFADQPYRRANLIVALGRAGQGAESRERLARLEEDARAGRAPAGVVAYAYAGLGDKDRAFEWFNRAFEERSSLVVEDLQIDPRLEVLRDDPRYHELLRKFRFVT
jgi:adenylate cyclase